MNCRPCSVSLEQMKVKSDTVTRFLGRTDRDDDDFFSFSAGWWVVL